MLRYLGILIASLLLIPGSFASEPLFEVERSGGTSRLWVESGGKQQLLRETDAELTLLDAGGDPTGRAMFANWDEEGETWSAHSRDGGASWSPSRPLERQLRLVDGSISPEAFFEDTDVFVDGQSWYYLIKAVDACGNEGP